MPDPILTGGEEAPLRPYPRANRRGYHRPSPQACYRLQSCKRVRYVRTSVGGPKTMGEALNNFQFRNNLLSFLPNKKLLCSIPEPTARGYHRSSPQASYGLHNCERVRYVRTSVRGPKTMGEALNAFSSKQSVVLPAQQLAFVLYPRTNRRGYHRPDSEARYGRPNIRWCERRAPMRIGGRNIGCSR
jgi:hypothetical protein